MLRAYQEGGDDGEESTESQHDGVANALRQQRLASEETFLSRADAIDDREVLRARVTCGRTRRHGRGTQSKYALNRSDSGRSTSRSGVRRLQLACDRRRMKVLLFDRCLYTQPARAGASVVRAESLYLNVQLLACSPRRALPARLILAPFRRS